MNQNKTDEQPLGEDAWVMDIINSYYPEGTDLRRVFLTHSRMVRNKAVDVCQRHPELNIDLNFVAQAAMLHDIGIFRCHAPGIYCTGTEPYIRHGVEGANILRALGRDKWARVCERHTGAGLTAESIIRQQLPLPHQDFLPESLEEQMVCYADNFFSKTHPTDEKPVEKIETGLAKFGQDGLHRFQQWHRMFG